MADVRAPGIASLAAKRAFDATLAGVWMPVAMAGAAMIGSIVIFLAWRRSLRLIREGLRMSRISSMQAMISAIAHELNQPLAATSNYLAVVSRRLDGRN